ncbi:MAG: hypothetical protein ACI86M_000755 [Saprospiraceae bacterium]|jgi:hypothetical protein
MTKYTAILFALLIIISCGSKTANYPSIDLLKHGFSISVKAPAEAKIESDDLGVMKELTIQSGEEYNLQILKSNSNTTVVADALSGQMKMVKTDRYFTKVIEEHDNGFIFEKDIDGNINYDFRYIKLIGDQEYIFQTGMMGTYTEEAVRTMYESVK